MILSFLFWPEAGSPLRRVGPELPRQNYIWQLNRAALGDAGFEDGRRWMFVSPTPPTAASLVSLLESQSGEVGEVAEDQAEESQELGAPRMSQF